MVQDTAFYSYVPADLHPDTLAMICFTVFFPWIGDTVEFPEPVSDRLVEAINRPVFRKVKGPIDVLNKGGEPRPVDDDAAVHAKECAVSFGGGVDSSALHALFPEATLVFEERRRLRRQDDRSATHDAMLGHEARTGTPFEAVRTNARHLAWPRGVTNWMSLLVPSLLVAMDRGLRGVLVGSNMPTMFMKGGVHYVPRHIKASPALQALEDFTVPIIQASGGISHLTATKICADAGITETLTFCQRGQRGAPCSKCLKCFRRETLYRILHQQDPTAYPLDAFPTDMSVYGEKYDLRDAAGTFEPGRPASNAHNLALGRDFLGDEFPARLREVGRNVPDATFMWHWPPEADALFPEEFHEHILSRIHQAIPEMTGEEVAAFRSWSAAG